MAQRKISAVYMRGGTSKGVFFRPEALPADPVLRDAILLRVIG
ncbi:MAG: 2-methylaconitate isomerase, partial [Paraburkholderia sp.]